MARRPQNIQERFHLSRENFILNPYVDSGFYANRTDVPVQYLIESLEIDLATGQAPKRLYWGPYGGGKTHTLLYTMRELGKKIALHSVYVECPVVTRKSTFVDLYATIMRTMGQRFVVGLFDDTVDQLPTTVRAAGIAESLKEILRDDDLAEATSRLWNREFDPSTFWAWLSGVSLRAAQLQQLGLVSDLTIAQPARLARYLEIIGERVRVLRKKTLLLILDETERLAVVAPENEGSYATGFTRLTDPVQNSVALLISTTVKTFEGMPGVFSEPVLSRLGPERRVNIPPLPDPDVEAFMEAIVRYVTRGMRRRKQIVGRAQSKTNESVKAESYPFTVECLEAIKSRLGPSITPRDIMQRLTRAAGRAHILDKPIVDSSCVI